GEFGLQHLDGDPAMMLEVLSEIDRRHPPAAELTLDRVAGGEGGLQAGEKVGHAETQEVRDHSIIGSARGRARGRFATGGRARESPQNGRTGSGRATPRSA